MTSTASTDIHGLQLETVHIPGPGHRRPLVFLHEGLGSVSMWHQRGRNWPQELCAATGRAGWVYSRRGYGRSDPVEDVRGPSRMQGAWHIGRHEPDYMHREAMEVLPALLRAWQVEDPILVGHSDGATIALLHASRFLVTGCVVMAPHVVIEDIALKAIAQARDAYQSIDPRGLRERLSKYHADVDNAFWQWNDVWLSPAFRSYDIQAECQGIHAPVLAIQGVDDEYGTLDQLRRIQLAVPDTLTVEIAQCGHSPHRDQPEQVTQAIQGFLAALP